MQIAIASAFIAKSRILPTQLYGRAKKVLPTGKPRMFNSREWQLV